MNYLENVKNYYCSSYKGSSQGDSAFVLNTGVVYKGMDEEKHEHTVMPATVPPN